MKQRTSTWLALGVLGLGVLAAAIHGVFVYLDISSRAPVTVTEEETASGVDEQALARANPGFLYGRVITEAGATYEGRLRWSGGQEAFWGDFFNGASRTNLWAAQVPPDRLPKESPLAVFGVHVSPWDRRRDLRRPFVARFGDIARIDTQSNEMRVTLKSGTVSVLDRMEANDLDKGLRLWQDGRIVAFAARQVRSIELLPAALLAAAPVRLHGSVRTRQGSVFTGFLQWDREQSLGSDTLDGRAADADLRLRFDTLGSIARQSSESALVTLLDGRTIVLSGRRSVGSDNRGIYVDDRRYGRVRVAWDSFERVDFDRAGSGPAYRDFPPGRVLTGSVTTRTGSRFAGRLVYDLDESETTDNFDARSNGVDYMLPFGLVASIGLPGLGERGGRAGVVLQSGQELHCELTGDLADSNGGVLVFIDGRPAPEYVTWADVARVDLNRPAIMYPPLNGG